MMANDAITEICGHISEMDELISAYEELCWLLSEYQSNQAENGFLPVNLMEKLNAQLRDTCNAIKSGCKMVEQI